LRLLRENFISFSTKTSSSAFVKAHSSKIYEKVRDCVKRLQNLSLEGAKQTLALFKQEIDVLFYDATTLYFESFTGDDLKQNGYSKDLKFNQPQVLLCLFVTVALSRAKQ